MWKRCKICPIVDSGPAASTWNQLGSSETSEPTIPVHVNFFLGFFFFMWGVDFEGCKFQTDNCLCLIINIDDSCQLSVLSVSLQFLKLAVRM